MRALAGAVALMAIGAPAWAQASGEAQAQAAPDAQRVFTYRVKGSIEITPSAIADDGARTYIEWRGDQPMPATFAIGDDGREQVVDGYVRDGVFTIDDVFARLIFRKDRLLAEARRSAGSGR